MKVYLEFERKNSKGKFETAYKSPKIDWCGLMAGKSLANRFLKSILDQVKDTMISLFHPCPFENDFALINATLGRELLIIFPPHVFRVIVKIKNTEPSAKVLVNFAMEGEVLP